MKAQRLLNLGCGSRYRPGWTNVDRISQSSEVLAHDLARPLPFEEGSFDLVYHSHVLEHFSADAGKEFLRECARVLRPGGILRVAVPDLEAIAREYLSALARARSGEPNAELDHEWMTLELYDQTVRDVPGGQMLRYFMRDSVPNIEFVAGRIGSEAHALRAWASRARADEMRPEGLVPRFARRARAAPAHVLRRMIAKAPNDPLSALRVGRFRRSGEVHQWMYDRLSLGRALHIAGLEGVVERSALESYADHWSDHHLDTEPSGMVYKPDSLFMEGLKPDLRT